MRYMHWYQCVYLVNIPEPVQYDICAVAFPFDLRFESVTYVFIYYKWQNFTLEKSCVFMDFQQTAKAFCTK